MDFIDFQILDAIDIILAALLFWQVFRMIRGTAAMAIFAGVFMVYLLWVTVRLFNMELLTLILGQIIGVGMLALIIVFQQEVRRYLLMLGNRYTQKGGLFRFLFTRKSNKDNSPVINEIAKACLAMSSHKTGALIAIEQTGNLDMYASTGDMLDARVSERLIENIFFKNAPLHDGAMIVANNRITAARCILPSSDNPNIPAELGMRHRAAIGLTEHSDALVVVVSEETGRISVARSAELTVVKSAEQLIELLTSV